MEGSFKQRINGSMLGSFIDKTVLILGQFMSNENNNLKLKCSDNIVIMVQMQEPLKTYIAPNCLMELIVIPVSRNFVKCVSYVILPGTASDFDFELYNEMIKVSADCYTNNCFIVNNLEKHFGGQDENSVDFIASKNENATNKQTKMEQSFY